MLTANRPTATTPNTTDVSTARRHRLRQRCQMTIGGNMQRVRHLGERRKSEHQRGHDVAARPEQPSHPGRGLLRRRHFLVEPAEVCDHAEREVEELRRDPHEVDRNDRRPSRSAPASVAATAGRVRAARNRYPQKAAAAISSALRTRKPFVPNSANERRREERIREGLSEEVAVRIGVGRVAVQKNGGRSIRPKRSIVRPFFRKTPVGPDGNSRQTRTRSSRRYVRSPSSARLWPIM